MYTKQSADNRHAWAILDPDGDYICTVVTEEGADALLSHLNRRRCRCYSSFDTRWEFTKDILPMLILAWLKPKGYNNPSNLQMLWNQWLHQGFLWGWYSYEAHAKWTVNTIEVKWYQFHRNYEIEKG